MPNDFIESVGVQVKETESINTAKIFIKARWGVEPPFIDARKSPADPSMWSVVFESMLSDGRLVDGPVVVLVDEITGRAMFFDTWFEKGRPSRI